MKNVISGVLRTPQFKQMIPWLLLLVSSAYLLAGYVLLAYDSLLASSVDVIAMWILGALSYYDLSVLKSTEKLNRSQYTGLTIFALIGLVLPTVYLGARAFYTGTPANKAYPLLISATAFMVIPVVLHAFRLLNVIH